MKNTLYITDTHNTHAHTHMKRSSIFYTTHKHAHTHTHTHETTLYLLHNTHIHTHTHTHTPNSKEAIAALKSVRILEALQ